jgi:hypothetical protein
MTRIIDLTQVATVEDTDEFPIGQASSGRTRSVAFSTIKDNISANVNDITQEAIDAANRAEIAAASVDPGLRAALADGVTVDNGADLVAFSGTETMRQAVTADRAFDADLQNIADPAKGAAIIGRSTQFVKSISELRALNKTSVSTSAIVSGQSSEFSSGGGLYRLDIADTTSAEDLLSGVVVATDGGRWKLSKTNGAISNAEAGTPGTILNDDGYAFGYKASSPPGTVGNGNKFNYYQLAVVADPASQEIGVNGATGPKVNGLHVLHNFGGSLSKGGRHAIEGNLLQGYGGAGTTSSDNQDRNYVGVQGQSLSDSGDGGTGPLDLRGAYFGTSSFAGISGDATYVRNVTAAELNTDIRAGTGTNRVSYHSGVQVASFIGERGFDIDAAVSVSNFGTSPLAWRHGMYFGSQNGGHAFQSDSTLVKIDPIGLPSSNMLLAFDFQGVNFTNAILLAPKTQLFDGYLVLNAPSASVELGLTTASSTPFVSLRSSGLNGSYDARMIGIGGTASSGRGVLQVDASELISPALRPASDNSAALGAPSFRWSVVYSATGTINTSDENAKQQIRPIDDAALRAWGKVEYQQYKFNDSVEEKGEGARWHFGVIAQRVIEAFESEGLSALEYGLLCYDEWEETEELRDEEGRVITPYRAPGGIYGIRYEEALALECAYLRSRLN